MTDADLERLEHELGKEEGALQTELGSLRGVAAELEARARKARELAEALATGGAEDVSTKLRGLVVPEVNDAAFDRARQAREDAIKVRREAAAQLKQTLAVTKRLLAELSGQLETGEAEARQTLERLEVEKRAAQETRTRLKVAEPIAEPPAGATALGTHLTIDQALTSAVLAALPDQRREQRRVRVQTSVDLQTDSNFYMAFSANISEGGIFVATVMLLAIGTGVDLDFSLPSGLSVQARGVVRWVREARDDQPDSYPGMGIQFTEIDAATQDEIRAFVAQRDPMFYVD